jgi:hypothetical protein
MICVFKVPKRTKTWHSPPLIRHARSVEFAFQFCAVVVAGLVSQVLMLLFVLARRKGFVLFFVRFSIADMSHFHFALFASFLSSSLALRTVSPKSWDETIAEAEVTLAKECGSECVAVLRSFVNASGTGPNDHSGDGSREARVLESMSKHGLEQMENAHVLMQSVVSKKAETVARSNVGHVRSEDTACGTPAECELRELAVNKCNYGRLALQNTYNSLNVVAHVLGSLVSTLCGCVHVEHVSHCILQNVPPMCTFPYTVYSKVFAGSVQVWEAVKASTKSCMLHRGPAIQA